MEGGVLMQVLMRDPGLRRRGILPALEVKAIDRCNQLGAWSVTVNGNDRRWERFLEGWGVLIQHGDWIMSGPAVEITEQASESSRERTVTIKGVDDKTVLDDSLTIPNPAEGATGKGTDLWKGSGVGETIIRRLINEQIGPGAPADYRIPHLILEPDRGRGATITVSTRWRNLLEEVAEQAQAAGLVFRVVQDGPNLVVKFEQGRNLARAVRLTRHNGGVGQYTLSRYAPDATEVIVGGVGSGATRKMWRVAKDTAPWGRRITHFVDRQSTADENELQQVAEEELKKGEAKSSVTFDARDIATARFGQNFQTGDRITVDLDDYTPDAEQTTRRVSDVVQIAELTGSASGVDVRLQVGPEPDETKLNQASGELVALVKKLSSQTRGLQTR
jgi:hypothetical protein